MGREGRHPDAKGQGLSRKERQQLKEQAKVQELAPLQEKLTSKDATECYQALLDLHEDLEGAHPPTFQMLAQAGIVSGLLQRSEDTAHTVQFQSLRCLTDLSKASEEDLLVFVEQGIVDVCSRLLSSKENKVREQSLTILGNIAGTSTKLRDLVISKDAASSVTALLKAGEQSVPVTQKVATFLCNMCSWELGNEHTDCTIQLLDTLALLVMSGDEHVILKACSGLSNLKYRNPHHLAILLSHAICDRLVYLLNHPNVEISKVAALASQKIACGTTLGMQAFLLSEPIPTLKDMLESEEVSRQRASCLLLTDIIRFGGPHIQEILDAGCIPLVTSLCKATASNDGDEAEVAEAEVAAAESRQAAALVIGAISGRLTVEQYDALIDVAMVESMVSMLDLLAFQCSSHVGESVLEFIENGLKAEKLLEQHGKPCKHSFKLLKEANAKHRIQSVLETCNDAVIRTRLEKLLERDL